MLAVNNLKSAQPMSASSAYLDQLLGGASPSKDGQPAPIAKLDSLFGGKTASAYLDSLLSGGKETSVQESQPQRPTDPNNPLLSGGKETSVQESQPQRPTDPNNPESDAYRAKYGNYGKVKDIGSVDLANVDSVAEMALRGGWADPKAFNLDMLDKKTPIMSSGSGGSKSGSGPWVVSPVRFKPEFAAARAMGEGYGALNQVGYLDQVLEDGSRQVGYRVKAGEVNDAGKRGADIYYEYDDKGNFKNAYFDVLTSTFEDFAPLISMGAMAVGLGGLGAGLGASANSSLGLGLGSTGQAALGGAIIGGGTSALTGQNPVKGAALGAIGSSISAANPAGAIVDNPVAQRAINGAIVGGTRSVLTGQDLSEGAIKGGINGAINGAGKRNRTA